MNPDFNRSATEDNVNDIPTLEDVLSQIAKDESEPYADLQTDNASDKSDPRLETGSECAIKNLYEGPPKCACCINWIEQYPDDLKDSTEGTSDSKRHALILRHTKSHQGKNSIELDSIVVQSPHLKRFLPIETGAYKGITQNIHDVIFRKPFQAFFHLWDQIQEGASRLEDEEAKSHVRLLIRVLNAELKEIIVTHREFLNRSIISFEFLWTVFKPGDLLYAPNKGQHSDQMYYLINSEYDTADSHKVFDLYCAVIDLGDAGFGFSYTWQRIRDFEGTKPISELSIYPAYFSKSFESLRAKMKTRGQKFHSLRGCQYKEYHGAAQEFKHSSIFGFAECEELHVDGRVVLDTEAYFRYSAASRPSISRSLRGVKTPVQIHSSGGHSFDSDDSSEEDNTIEFQYAAHRKDTLMDKQIRNDGVLTDVQLLICLPYMRGYSLKSKRWVQLDVDKIQDIKWNEDAFSSLILPGDTKKLILSFVESQVSQNAAFDDVIMGKGQGIIILLHGEPGVGKTLTAEAVAEVLRDPLYMISVGELGSKVDEIEKHLTRILELAAKWKAVLLLDEADVFLEQRSTADLERNRVVSIFLRTLEYYKGVLFITTNRVKSFDEAFKSRIHLSLKYRPLSVDHQKEIWKNFLNRSSPQSKFSEADLTKITQRPMNGREIKNTVKMAHLLSSKEQKPLAISHISRVIASIYDDGVDDGVGCSATSVASPFDERGGVSLRKFLDFVFYSCIPFAVFIVLLCRGVVGQGGQNHCK